MIVYLVYDTDADRSDIFRLIHDLTIEATDGTVFVIPAGFESDGASVPQFLQSFVSTVSFDFPADVLHDYLYTHKEVPYTRKQVDAYWLEFMQRFNPDNRLRTWVKYRYVRLLGWWNWYYYRR